MLIVGFVTNDTRMSFYQEERPHGPIRPSYLDIASLLYGAVLEDECLPSASLLVFMKVAVIEAPSSLLRAKTHRGSAEI
jgi:hypothetical protein